MTESQDEMPVPWQTLTELLRTVAEQATFDVRHRGIYSASQFRDIYYRSTDVDSLLVLSAEPRGAGRPSGTTDKIASYSPEPIHPL